MTPLRVTALAGVTVALATSGCGGSSDQESIKANFGSFQKAVRNHDGNKACSLLTDAARKSYESQVGLTCQQLLKQAPENPSLRAGIDRVEVRGDQATIFLTGGRPPVQFQKVNGAWKVGRGAL